MVLSRHNDTKTGQSTKKYSRRKTKIHQHYLDVILQYGFEPTPPPTPEEEESEEEQDEDEDGFAGGLNYTFIKTTFTILRIDWLEVYFSITSYTFIMRFHNFENRFAGGDACSKSTTRW